jgi:hypothetical protein
VIRDFNRQEHDAVARETRGWKNGAAIARRIEHARARGDGKGAGNMSESSPAGKVGVFVVVALVLLALALLTFSKGLGC